MEEKIIPISVLRRIKEYKKEMHHLTKIEILEDVIHFDDNFKKGKVTVKELVRAQALMDRLQELAELNELKNLALKYKRKIAHELYSKLQSGSLHTI
jgi:hypothetical protein